MTTIRGVSGGSPVDKPDPVNQGNRPAFDDALKAAGIEKTKPTEPKPQGSGGQPPPPSPPPPK